MSIETICIGMTLRTDEALGGASAIATSCERTLSRTTAPAGRASAGTTSSDAGDIEARQRKCRVLADNFGDEQRAGLVPPGRGAEVDAPEDILDRPGGDDLAVRQHHDVVGKPRHLVDLVADIEDRYAALVRELFKERQDLGAAGAVETGERLVHQQNVGRRHQSAADRDALRLAAR